MCSLYLFIAFPYKTNYIPTLLSLTYQKVYTEYKSKKAMILRM